MNIINQYTGVSGGIPRDGLIGEWLFNGNANDTSGNGNDGIPIDVTLTSDRNGNTDSAYQFVQDTSNRVSYGSPAILDNLPDNDFSLSMWVKPITTDGWGSIYSSRSLSQKGVLCRLYGAGLNDLNIQMIIFFENQYMNYVSNEKIPHSSWSHITYVFDEVTKTTKIYINGVETSYKVSTAGDGAFSGDTGTEKQSGILYSGDTLQTFGGDMDLFRIYDRALTQEEITELYNE